MSLTESGKCGKTITAICAIQNRYFLLPKCMFNKADDTRTLKFGIPYVPEKAGPKKYQRSTNMVLHEYLF